MNLANRKPRPFRCDKQSFRDDRLFIVATDDTYVPEQYFGFLRIPRVQVHVVQTTDGSSSAQHVLNRLLQYEHDEDDQLWLLLDTDHYTTGNHLAGFMRAIADARDNGVRVALSRPCFDLWLLLHHVPHGDVACLAYCEAVGAKIREIKGEFNKTNLKEEHYPQDAIIDAFDRARQLDAPVAKDEIPAGNVTRVYKLLAEILSSSPASQLPEAFVALRNQHGML